MSETVDAILRGRVRVIQPEHGSRFAVDPILLADFVVRRCGVRARRAADLGSGSGVLSLVLATLDPRLEVTGFEIQPDLVALASRSAELNQLQARVRFHATDVAEATGEFDLVVANPPYHQGGPVSPDPARATAHHGRIEDFVAAARRLVAPRGRFAMVYPPDRLQDVLGVFEGFRLRALRFVHPRAGQPASRVLLLAQSRVKATCHVLPPLYLHDGDAYSPEATAILEGKC